MFFINKLFKEKNKNNSKAYSEQVAEFLNREPLIKRISSNTISLSENMGYTTAIFGWAGSGRTNTAAVLLEELVAKGIAFTAIDLNYQGFCSEHLNSQDLPDNCTGIIDIELGNVGQITSFKEATTNKGQMSFAPLKSHSIVVDKTGKNLPQIRNLIATELAHHSVAANVPILINQGQKRHSFDKDESETSFFVLQYLHSLLNSLIERKNSGSGEDSQQHSQPPYFLIIDELPSGMINIIEEMAIAAKSVNLHVCYIHFNLFGWNDAITNQLLPHTDTFYLQRQEWLSFRNLQDNQELLETLVSRADTANMVFPEILKGLRPGEAIFFPPSQQQQQQQAQPIYLQFEISRWLERLTADEEKQRSLWETSGYIADDDNNNY